ncbi:MAG: hypothetical protein WBK91_00420 [Alphaproteobacteria bacterium]
MSKKSPKLRTTISRAPVSRVEIIQNFVMAASAVVGLTGIALWYSDVKAGEPIAAAAMGIGSAIAGFRGLVWAGNLIDNHGSPAKPTSGTRKLRRRALTA